MNNQTTTTKETTPEPPVDCRSGSSPCYADVDACIRARPESLTLARAESFLPTMDVDEEWQRKHDAGELEDGLLGMRGMLTTTWPDTVPSREEAEWLLALLEFGSWRWMASIVLHGDDNQINALHLKEVSERVLSA